MLQLPITSPQLSNAQSPIISKKTNSKTAKKFISHTQKPQMTKKEAKRELDPQTKSIKPN